MSDFQDDDPDLEICNAISEYEIRLVTRLANPANALLDELDSNYAVLHLLMSYFEPYAGRLYGVDTAEDPKKYFVAGLCSVFCKQVVHEDGKTTRTTLSPVPDLNDLPQSFDYVGGILYLNARFGFVHKMLGNPSVLLSSKLKVPLFLTARGDVEINTELFYEGVIKNMTAYIHALEDKKNIRLRENFMKVEKR